MLRAYFDVDEISNCWVTFNAEEQAQEAGERIVVATLRASCETNNPKYQDPDLPDHP